MPNRVILIEDDPVTIKLTGDALARVAPDARLEVMRDGLGAVERLLRHSDNARDRIVLVILDLHIPRLHGIELLRELKSRVETRFLPVVVISGTATPDQTRELYALGANSYVLKVADPAVDRRNIERTLEYWLLLNVLPVQTKMSSQSVSESRFG
jgi:chemotaxis family two-component system response regulator Rcp1